jgi:hypothetical protein
MRVEILIKGGEEYGKIREKLRSKKIDFSKIKTPFILFQRSWTSLI